MLLAQFAYLLRILFKFNPPAAPKPYQHQNEKCTQRTAEGKRFQPKNNNPAFNAAHFNANPGLPLDES